MILLMMTHPDEPDTEGELQDWVLALYFQLTDEKKAEVRYEVRERMARRKLNANR